VTADDDPMVVLHDRFGDLYSEFLKIARRRLRRLRTPSFWTTDLVHESFLKLVAEEADRLRDGRSSLGKKPSGFLKACFGQACLHIVIDRNRRAGRKAEALRELASMRVPVGSRTADVIEVAEVIEQLRQRAPDQADVVQATALFGLSARECADLLHFTPKVIRTQRTLGLCWIKPRLFGDVDDREVVDGSGSAD
jgi:DNA-directed RNA polymerase specialized sigma24 family protein